MYKSHFDINLLNIATVPFSIQILVPYVYKLDVICNVHRRDGDKYNM